MSRHFLAFSGHALNGKIPNWCKPLTVTLNWTLTRPTDATLVTSLPSFLVSSSVGETYSAGLPLKKPKIEERIELLIGQKTWI